MEIRIKAKNLILFSVLILALFIGFNAFYSSVKNTPASPSFISVASAQEIYPFFKCPCCNTPLDKKKICCGLARERIEYIDSLVNNKLSEKELISSYIKKYGLNSFADSNKEKEFREELVKSAPKKRPVIAISPSFVDMGDISPKKGVAFTFFEIKNQGKEDLIINKLNSSCGCTSASVVFGNQEGPRFAMDGHGIKNPTDWQISIPPGQTAMLKVYYDPNVHKDFRGAAIRTISVFSNDPIDFEKEVKIELNQVD